MEEKEAHGKSDKLRQGLCYANSETKVTDLTGWSDIKNFVTKSRSKQAAMSEAGIFPDESPSLL